MAKNSINIQNRIFFLLKEKNFYYNHNITNFVNLFYNFQDNAS